MQKVLLHDNWEMHRSDEPEWIAATVPGTVYTDLLNAGKMEDPFWKDNEDDALKRMDYDYEYRTSFACEPALLSSDEVILRFDGLDTIADGVRFPHANYDYVFSNCDSLPSYPDGLFQIDDGNGNYVSSCNNAFEFCTSLTDIGDILDDCGFNETTDFSHLFYGCTSLTYSRRDARRFPPRASYIFYGCNSLTEFPLWESGVISDMQYAFAYSGIQYAQFNNAITHNYVNLNNAFVGCTALYRVRFPYNGLYVQSMIAAFMDCTGLSEVQNRAGIYISGDGRNSCLSAFNGCTNLSSFAQLDSFISLGWDEHNMCFYDCTSLPEYNDLPDGWK